MNSDVLGSSSSAPDLQATGRAAAKQLRWIFVCLLLVTFLAALDQIIVATALPTIVGELGGLEHMSWVVIAYTLAMAVAMPVYGKLGDVFGRKRLFIAAITLFLIGSALCGFSQNLWQLIGFRALQGLGGAGLLVGGQAIVADVVPPRDRGKFLGPIGSVFGLATVISPLIGGALTDAASWRWIFWLNLPLGAIALGIAVFALHLPRRRRETPLDIWGIAVLTVTTSCIVLVFAWGGTEYAWTSTTMVMLIAAAVIGSAVFALVEQRAVDPLIPLSMLANRTVLIAIGLSLVIGAGLFGVISYIPSYAQMVYATGATAAGMLLLPLTAGIMATNITAGLLISRYGRYKIFPIVGTIVAGGAMILLATMTAATPIWLLAVYLTVLGMGVGMFMQVAMVAVQSAVPAGSVGTATSTVTFFREIGVTIGAAVIGGAFGARLAGRLPGTLPAGLDAAHLTPEVAETLPTDLRDSLSLAYIESLVPLFFWIAPLFAVGLLLALLLPEHELSRNKPGAGGREKMSETVTDPTLRAS